MKKLFIGLFAAVLAAGIIGCSNPSDSSGGGSSGGTDTPTTPDTPATPTYTVTVNESENGTVTASKTSGIAAGETISLTVTPGVTETDDYELETLSVKNGDTDVTVTDYAFTMPAANVTVSATFNKIIYIGTKKPSIAKEVGDIVFNDGSAMAYADWAALENGNDKNAKKNAAIALIFYKGTGLNSDDSEGNADTTTSRTLGVGLKHDRGIKWRYDYYNAPWVYAIHCYPILNGSSFKGDKNGSDNFEEIENVTSISSYPAFCFGKNYATLTVSNIPINSEFATGWYLPSIAELFQIYANGKGENMVFNIDAASEALGGDSFGISNYWSSSQAGSEAYLIRFDSGGCHSCTMDNTYVHYDYSSMGGYTFNRTNCVCCVREFN